MTSLVVQSNMTKRGVALNREAERTKVGKYVHVTTDEWNITSDIPIGDDLLTCSILDRVLPGLLGGYVLPFDSVFHLRAKATTTLADFKAVVEFERESHGRAYEERLNHMSVSLITDDVHEEEEEEEECEEEEEEEEEDTEGESEAEGEEMEDVEDGWGSEEEAGPEVPSV